MDDGVPLHTLDAVPRLYALRREEDEDGPAEVIAWGLAFADGRALTLWCDPPHPGAFTAFGSLQTVEQRYAPNAGADLIWLPAPVGVQLPRSSRHGLVAACRGASSGSMREDGESRTATVAEGWR
ncbi:MAG: hypothetical protein ACRDRW_05250 [Pseudonocardiaceae bacterium]